MKLRDVVSNLFQYKIKHGYQGWDEMANSLSKSGVWSITGSPRKFQDIIVELLKRVERLEHDAGYDTTIQPPTA
ncbi:MAG: hypothetical protein AAB895_04320 [Patescibacteria group bacterium]